MRRTPAMGFKWPGSDVLQYFVGLGLSRLATVIVVPIVGHVLGPSELGLFEATLAVMLASMIIADAGLGFGVLRFYSEARLQTISLLRVALRLQIGASVLAFGVMVVPAVVVAPPNSSALVVGTALAMFALVEGVAIVGTGFLRAADNGRLFLALSASRLVIAATVGTIGAVVGGVQGALFGIAVSGVGFAAVAVRATWVAKPTSTQPGLGRLLLGYGVPLMTGTVMIWTLSLSDRIFLRALRSPLELAEYAASYRLGAAVSLFVAAPLAVAWLPVAKRTGGGDVLIQRTLGWAISVAWASLGSAVLLIATADTLVPFVFGPELKADRVIVAIVAASGWLLGVYFLLATQIMLAQHTGRVAVIMLTSALFNTLTNAILINRWGAEGAAFGTGLSYLFLCLLTYLLLSPRGDASWLLHPEHVVSVCVLLALSTLAIARPTVAVGGLALGALIQLIWRGRGGSGQPAAAVGR